MSLNHPYDQISALKKENIALRELLREVLANDDAAKGFGNGNIDNDFRKDIEAMLREE